MPYTIRKVTAFITRHLAQRPPELLVFRHPTAGVQLPAGTIELDEAPDVAVLREVAEETGLTQVHLLSQLDTQTQTLSDDHRAILHPTQLQIGPNENAQILNLTFKRGAWVRVVGEVGPFSEVVWEEIPLYADPPIPDIRVSGWLSSRLLAHRLERHFFHLTPTAPTPEVWETRSDRNHLFRSYWVPLSPKPELVRGQDSWLDLVYDRLLETVS